MPHIIIKVAKGLSAAHRNTLTEMITEAIVKVTGNGPEAVSVAIKEYDPAEWLDKVYVPDILVEMDGLDKKPGYDPFRKEG